MKGPLNPPLFGREADLARLVAMCDGARLVAITGPMGIGKSRLLSALGAKLGERHPKQVLLVALDDYSLLEVERMLRDVAEVGTGRRWILLDHVESEFGWLHSTLERFLAEDPSLSFVVASRRTLCLSDGARFIVGPLRSHKGEGCSPAAALFADLSVRIIGVDITDWATVERIVTALGGEPLSISLAAQRTRLLSLAQLLASLESATGALTLAPLRRGHIGTSARHRNLDVAFSLSWNLLSRPEQAALAAVAYIAQPFDLAIGAQLLQRVLQVDPSRSWELLEALVQHNVLVRDDGGFVVPTSVRACAESRAQPAVSVAYGEILLGRMRRLLSEGSRGPVLAAQQSVAALASHLRQVAHGSMDIASPAIAGMVVLCLDLANQLEERDDVLLCRLLEHPSLEHPALESDQRIQVSLFELRGRRERMKGRLEESAECFRTAESLALEANLLGVVARARGGLAVLRLRAGDGEGALELARAANEAGEDCDNPRDQAIAKGALAAVYFEQGDRQTASKAFAGVVAIARDIEDTAMVAELEGLLGNIAHTEAHLAEASRHYARAIDAAEVASEAVLSAIFSGYQALVHHEQGHLPEALHVYAGAIAHLSSIGVWRHECLFRAALGAAQAASGDLSASGASFSAVRGRIDKDPTLMAAVETHRGHLHLADAADAARRGDETEAERQRERAASCLEAAGDHTTDDAIIAARILLGALESSSAATRDVSELTIGADGRWLERRGGDRVDLRRRGPIRRILVGLAKQHRKRPNVALTPDEVIALGWPGEKIQYEAARHRLRVAIWTLRRLGLGEVLVTLDEGYQLDPSIAVSLSEE